MRGAASHGKRTHPGRRPPRHVPTGHLRVNSKGELPESPEVTSARGTRHILLDSPSQSPRARPSNSQSASSGSRERWDRAVPQGVERHPAPFTDRALHPGKQAQVRRTEGALRPPRLQPLVSPGAKQTGAVRGRLGSTTLWRLHLTGERAGAPRGRAACPGHEAIGDGAGTRARGSAQRPPAPRGAGPLPDRAGLCWSARPARLWMAAQAGPGRQFGGRRRPGQQTVSHCAGPPLRTGPGRGQLSGEDAPTPRQGRREGARSTRRKGSSTVERLRNPTRPHCTVKDRATLGAACGRSGPQFPHPEKGVTTVTCISQLLTRPGNRPTAAPGTAGAHRMLPADEPSRFSQI